MYDMNEYATVELNRQHATTGRHWLTVGAGLAAVLGLVVLIVFACSARSNPAGPPLGAVTTPTTSAGPAATADPAPPTAPPDQPAGGGDNPGPPPAPPNPPNPPPPPDPPQPLSIKAITFGSLPATCHAKGKITVSGGEYPIPVSYVFYFMDQVDPNLPPVAVGMGWQSVDIHGPGDTEVSSPKLPQAQSHQVQLRVEAPEQSVGSWVTYPACTE